MNWSAFLSGFLGTTIPAFVGSLIMLHLKKRIDQSQEHLKGALQQDLIKFTKWHEKRLAALEAIYQAFCTYLDFLRRTLYIENGNTCLDPMHEFRNAIEQQMLYLDDSMARKVSQYQGELLLFWNSAITSLSSQGEAAREKIRRQLDYEIPAYLPRLQEDINQFLDPNYEGDEESFRRLIAAFGESKGEPTRR